MTYDIAIIGAGIAGASLAAEVAPHASVAHFDAAQGFKLKSVAVWKKVLARAPSNTDARAQVIALYRSLGLEHDARALEEPPV